MDRVERAGLGVAVAGHVALFAALSVGLLATPKPLVAPRTPVDVRIVDEVGLKDTAPAPAEVEP
ncbi:MAG: cell envelope biogenesis protein TolA, partial [Sphingomonadaceae bacterium]|nr:cell envelope biogenesis protein TolA [Sphingomonadaceae bacterium]